MVAPTETSKAAFWLACKQKTCCHDTWVVPTGRDIWRIARVLQTPPWSFLRYFLAPRPSRDSFRLDASDRLFRTALAKGTPRRKGGRTPCIFLLSTRDGHHRCGLGDLRPLACHAFPSDLVDGVLCLRPDAGCTCRTWTLADVDIAAEVAAVERREAAGEEFCAIVERWNARVASAPASEAFTFPDYCTYLLEAYDRLATDDPKATP